MQISLKLHEAIITAAIAHQGQYRKGTNIDYLVHPMEVLEILTGMGADETLKIAGVLHDTVEDTDFCLEDIRRQFGEEVYELVKAHTEDKSLTWQERKEEGIKKLQEGSPAYQMMILGDALSNLRSMVADYRQIGDALWSRFKAPKERQAWYYGQMNLVFQGMKSNPVCEKACTEFEQLYLELHGE